MPRFAAARTALLPAFEWCATADLTQALDAGGPSLVALIRRQHLAPLWHARTKAEVFAGGRINAAMVYMRQLAAQHEIDKLFEKANIEYAIFKGAASRELSYEIPSVRVCADIDMLVAPEQRVAAARILINAGYVLRVDRSVVSHEVTLNKGIVAIDLHWDLLRPGRIPPAMTAEMLARRQRFEGRWIFAETDALFVMLIHPAFSKHLSTRQMGLHRVSDIVLWLQRRSVDWPALHRQLSACGLQTTAWTMLSLVRMLSPVAFADVIDDTRDSLRPGPFRAAYLTTWLNQDMSTRLISFHAARLLGLSAVLHDEPSGAWRAWQGWRRSRTSRDADALVFEGLITK